MVATHRGQVVALRPRVVPHDPDIADNLRKSEHANPNIMAAGMDRLIAIKIVIRLAAAWPPTVASIGDGCAIRERGHQQDEY